jgi:hypothetical protein
LADERLALGITDEVEEMEMKGSKKKKSRQLDGDFVVCHFSFPSAFS